MAAGDDAGTDSSRARHRKATSTSVALVLALVAVWAIFELGKYYWTAHNAERDRAIYAQQVSYATTLKGASGTDFLLGKQRRYVRAVRLHLPDEIRRTDSLAVVFSLQDLGTNAKRDQKVGLADEKTGSLRPTLTAGDCTVTAQDSALEKSTEEPFPAFVWQWSIDDCKTAGYKSVLLLLSYRGNSAGDAVAYRDMQFVHVTDELSSQDVIAFVGAAATILAAVATGISAFSGGKNGKKRA